MTSRYRLLPVLLPAFLLVFGLLGEQTALAQSNCTSPYLGENGPALCVTITPTPGGTPVILRSLATLANASIPIVGTYGEYDLNLTATYAFGGTGMGVDITGTVTRSTVGTESISIDVEGGWGAVLPGGGGDVTVSGFATGTALVQQGSAAGFPAGAGPAQDIEWFGFPPTCYEPVYGPRPPGNPGAFDCKRIGTPVEAGAVAVRGITVVNINEVGEMVDLPAGTGLLDPPSVLVPDSPTGAVAGRGSRMCGPDGCTFLFEGIVTGTPAPNFTDVNFLGMGVTAWRCFGPDGTSGTATSYGDPGNPSNPPGCYIEGAPMATYSAEFDVSCPGEPQDVSLQVNSNPDGEVGQIPLRCVATGTPGSISGLKYEDLNGNGLRDVLRIENDVEVLEPAIPNWPIYLDDEGLSGSPFAYTDENGKYVLSGIEPGEHAVTEGQVEGWYPSTQNSGTVAVKPGEETPEIDFGNYRLGIISGYKWQDDDGDGVWDASEQPIKDWSITCEGGNCSSGITFTTDDNGFYAFGNLIPGDYVISEEPVSGWTQTFPTTSDQKYHLTLHSAEHLQENNFGNQPLPPPSDDADYGDAPESVDPELADLFPTGYPTTKANNGASHVIDAEVRLGDKIDPEEDGMPTLPADGDDETTDDDEDGVEFVSDFVQLSLALDPASEARTDVAGQIQGENGRIAVYPSTSGKLDGWVDWNRDGDWDDNGEHIYDGEDVGPEPDTLDWSVPGTADPGFTYARFRFTLAGIDTPGGAAPTGEVEDYLLYTLNIEELTSADDTGDANPGDGLCADGSGNCTLRAAIDETNASGAPWLLSAENLAKSGRAVMQPQSPYPPITGSLLLNGADNLEIDGSQAGAGADGFVLQSGGNYIVASDIHSFDGDGVRSEEGGNAIFENAIHDNTGNGITVLTGSGTVLRSNSLYGNGGLGIDLGDDGVTSNDVGDADIGPNGLQNFPTLSTVSSDGNRIMGSLASSPNERFYLEFYTNPACDASGYGEGRTYLVSTFVDTDNQGMASFEVGVEEGAIAEGDAVTAIALREQSAGSTSEFSPCETAVATAIEQNPGAEVPEEYHLYGNYPNPFNPSTTIRFALSKRERVTLAVFDLLGRKVATLVDGPVEAGEFTVEFDARDLPSGTYIYRMTAGSFSDSKQLTLLK